MAFSVSYIYDIIDKYSPKLKKIEEQTKKVTKKIEDIGEKTKKVGDDFSSFAKKSALATGAIAGGLIIPIKAAADFEFAIKGVERAMNDIKTPEDLKEIEEITFKLSKEFGSTASKMADAAAAAGRMNIPKKDMEGFLRTVGRAAIAFDILEEEASRALGNIGGKFVLNQEQVRGVADSIAHLENNTRASARDIINVLERTSGAFKNLGVDPAQAASVSAFARQIEVSSERAATGLNVLIENLPKLGVPTKELRKDFTGTLKEILLIYGKIDDATRRQIDIKVGDVAARFLRSASNQLKEYNRVVGLTSKKTKFLGTLQEEFNITMESAIMKYRMAKATMIVSLIKTGKTLLPITTKLIKKFTIFIDKIGVLAEKNPKLVESFAKIGIIGGLAITGITAAMGLLLSSIGFLAIGLGKLGTMFSTAVFGSIQKVLTISLKGFTRVSGIITAIIFLVKSLYEAFKILKVDPEFVKTIKSIGKNFKRIFKEIEPSLFLTIGLMAKLVLLSSKLVGFLTKILGTKIASFINNLAITINVLSGALAYALENIEKLFNYFTRLSGSLSKVFGLLGKKIFQKLTLPEVVQSKILPEIGKEELSINNRRELISSGTLNGNIDISVEGPGKIRSANMNKSMPGNLGMNLQPGL